MVCIALAMMTTAGWPQADGAGAPGNKSPLEGVWRADMNGLPAIALVLTTESGSLSGAVQFYFQHRDTVEQPWTSTPGLPEPMFNPKFDGKTLTFQISHRRAHPPRTLHDPPVTFRFTLIAPDKAGFVNEHEPATQGVLTRTDY